MGVDFVILQFIWWLAGQVLDYLFSIDLPDALWVGMGHGATAVGTIAGWFPAIPYIPYAAMSNVVSTSLTVFGAILLIVVVMFVLNIFLKFRR
ncbi:hypothetical protein [Demequina sp. NBRC 110054]|uniref:hypothetical protein n=1 Tax=Demequina sp. NBRC 110054 TaxID=1570343 RepID=UPI0009FCAA1D|nr:hypothetical protein [Demequina sp. NBRC 110054]